MGHIRLATLGKVKGTTRPVLSDAAVQEHELTAGPSLQMSMDMVVSLQ